MLALAPLPKFRAMTAGSLSSAPLPLVGGKLWTYAAGTTTPQPTYTDAGGLTPNTNPVILDARGEADVWLGAGGALKLVLTDAAGVVQWTTDNILSAEQLAREARAYTDALRSDLGTGGDQLKGAALLGFSPTLAYAFGTAGFELHQRASVKSFGAKGDGTTNDTAAIQAAHNAALCVYYPAGYYNVTGRISLRVGTRIQGDSAGASVVQLSADMAGAESAVFELLVTDMVTQQGGIVVRDVFVNGGGHFGHGFLLRNVRFPVFDNAWIMNFNGAALLFDYAEEGSLDFLNVNGCGRTSGNANVSADTLYGQITFDKTAAAVAPGNSNFLRFNNCTVANGRCSGDFLVKGGSPSRIYINDTQSELSAPAATNRDWLVARGMGGIFWVSGCDVVNYRNMFDGAQYLELHVSEVRNSNATRFYSGANGTGSLSCSGCASDGAIEITSINSLALTGNPSLGQTTLSFPNRVLICGNGLAGLSINGAGGTNLVNVVGNTVEGNLSIGDSSPVYSAVIEGNRITGTAYYGIEVRATDNHVQGAETWHPDAKVVQSRSERMLGQLAYGAAPPASGYYKAGSEVRNTAPAAGGFIGWVCVGEGAPGTWKGYGTIAA